MTKEDGVGTENVAGDMANAIAVKAILLTEKLIHLVDIETIAKATDSSEAVIAKDMVERRAGGEVQALAGLQALGEAARLRFIKTLWLLALTQHDWHDAEERLIYQISDFIGLSRKQLVKAGQEVAKALGPEVK